MSGENRNIPALIVNRLHGRIVQVAHKLLILIFQVGDLLLQ
jgi:hypothetical protein